MSPWLLVLSGSEWNKGDEYGSEWDIYNNSVKEKNHGYAYVLNVGVWGETESTRR